jgi:hypothetical protein
VTPLIQSTGNKNAEACGTIMQVKLPYRTAVLKNSTFAYALVFLCLFWLVMSNKIFSFASDSSADKFAAREFATSCPKRNFRSQKKNYKKFYKWAC